MALAGVGARVVRVESHKVQVHKGSRARQQRVHAVGRVFYRSLSSVLFYLYFTAYFTVYGDL